LTARGRVTRQPLQACLQDPSRRVPRAHFQCTRGGGEAGSGRLGERPSLPAQPERPLQRDVGQAGEPRSILRLVPHQRRRVAFRPPQGRRRILAVLRGRFRPGDPLPGYRKLAEQLGVRSAWESNLNITEPPNRGLMARATLVVLITGSVTSRIHRFPRVPAPTLAIPLRVWRPAGDAWRCHSGRFTLAESTIAAPRATYASRVR